MGRHMVEKLNNFLAKHFSNKLRPGADPIDVAIQIISELKGIKQEKTKILFSASVWYNDGLGNKNKELPNIEAFTFEEAKKFAEEKADEALKKWIEVRVKPIGMAQ